MYEKIQRKGKPVLQQKEKLGVEYLTFPGLSGIDGIRHLFSTRIGGISGGMFAGMNLSFSRGDEDSAVRENFKRIARCLGCDPADIVCSDQTHTINIRRVLAGDRGKGCVIAKDYADIDGLITDIPGIVLATFYADCVPLYFVDSRHRAVGLSHSGWKGTVNRMGQKTLEAMGAAFGTRPEEVRAAIGPSICQDCYEVSSDVAEQFMVSYPEQKNQILKKGRQDGKYQLDLWKANYFCLLDAGMPPEHIEVTDLCTCCNSEYLFSHRASGGKRGNLGAFLGLSPEKELGLIRD